MVYSTYNSLYTIIWKVYSTHNSHILTYGRFILHITVYITNIWKAYSTYKSLYTIPSKIYSTYCSLYTIISTVLSTYNSLYTIISMF